VQTTDYRLFTNSTKEFYHKFTIRIASGGAAESGNKGANCMEVDAWPIPPLANVGDENAKTYDQALAEYHERRDRNRDSDEPAA
jgi:hypothetical protein